MLAVAPLRPLGCLAPFGVLRSAYVGASRLSPSLLGRGCRPSRFWCENLHIGQKIIPHSPCIIR